MKIISLVFLLSTCALWRPAAAQSTLPASSAAPVAVTPGQRQAAATLLNTIYSEESFNQLIEQGLKTQLSFHPEIKPYENEMRTFFKKYMSWPALRGDMIDIYAQEFTEAELREMVHFYESPVGRKAAAKLPVLTQKGMELAQRRIQEHAPELQKLITEKTAH